MNYVLFNYMQYVKNTADKPMRINFIIMEEPTDDNIDEVIANFKRDRVKHLISLSENKLNNKDIFRKNDIKLHYLPIESGKYPSDSNKDYWLKLLKSYQDSPSVKTRAGSISIAINCEAGLGRAPIMFAIALIEIYKLDVYNSIGLIRNSIPKAFNQYQLNKLFSNYESKTSSCHCAIL